MLQPCPFPLLLQDPRTAGLDPARLQQFLDAVRLALAQLAAAMADLQKQAKARSGES